MKIQRIDDIFVIGEACALTSNLADNTQRSIYFWQHFNKLLNIHHLTQGTDFEKYAITYRRNQQLYYSCCIPSNGSYPKNFEIYRIPAGDYAIFQHIGCMQTIKDTIRLIFEDYLPKGQLQKRHHEIVFFEKYTKLFDFDNEASMVEIYVPLAQSSQEERVEIPAKTILQGGNFTGSFSWFGMDYNMNLYKGCSHGCVYCDSRSACYQIHEFDYIRIKEHVLTTLELDLRRKRKKGVVGIGAMSDTYNPYEKDRKITRNALLLLEKYGFGIGIDTKSTLILRDIDILQRIAENSSCIVKITITTSDDNLAKVIEPYAPSSTQRFKALETLHQAGIYAGILLMPILPFINDSVENIKEIVHQAHLHHAKFIYSAFGVTLRDNQRDYFYYQLDHYFPGKRQLYETYYHNIYSCNSLYRKELDAVFKKECHKYGIVYCMDDIIKGYKKRTHIQETLHF